MVGHQDQSQLEAVLKRQKPGAWLGKDALDCLLGLLRTCSSSGQDGSALSTALTAVVEDQDCFGENGCGLIQVLVEMAARERPQKAQVQALSALSQVVLAGHDVAKVAVTLSLQTITMHLCTGDDEAKNGGAILVNNMAAIGGSEV